MFDIVAIGSATRDAFFNVDLPTVPWPKAESKKAYVLPFGEKLEVKNVYFTVGGNSVNASVTFARQGFRSACAAKVGSDVSGEEIRRRLRKEGVNTNTIVNHPTLPTAYSVLIREKGERTILGYHGAADSFAINDLRLAKLRAKWWYVSLAGESDKMLLPLLQFAERNNIAVAFNPTAYHLRHKRGEVLKSLSKLAFLVLNEEEAALLTGVSFKNEKAVFRKLDKLVPGVLAVTDGRRGAAISDGKFIYRVGIFKEKKLVDRTGAGDAFGSGFVAGLMRRGVSLKNIGTIRPRDVAYAIRLATANAASVVEKVGATEGILARRDFTNSPRFRNIKIKVLKI